MKHGAIKENVGHSNPGKQQVQSEEQQRTRGAQLSEMGTMIQEALVDLKGDVEEGTQGLIDLDDIPQKHTLVQRPKGTSEASIDAATGGKVASSPSGATERSPSNKNEDGDKLTDLSPTDSPILKSKLRHTEYALTEIEAQNQVRRTVSICML